MEKQTLLYEYNNEIKNALFEPNLCISDWFNAFFTGEKFAQLTADEKQQVFSQYESIKYVLEQINDSLI